jgi:hypothetical protein
MRKNAYRATAVKSINVNEVISQLSEGPAVMGLEIGKHSVLAVIRDANGNFRRPWKVRNPKLRLFSGYLVT